jgi:hypothetical protein
MKTFAAFRTVSLTVLLCTGCVFAFSQSDTRPVQTPQSAAGGKDQKIEHIVHEDAGSKIEETRYGGITQSITVESKLGGMPYQIVPADGTRSIPPGWNNAKDSAGKAHWQIGTF